MFTCSWIDGRRHICTYQTMRSWITQQSWDTDILWNMEVPKSKLFMIIFSYFNDLLLSKRRLSLRFLFQIYDIMTNLLLNCYLLKTPEQLNEKSWAYLDHCCKSTLTKTWEAFIGLSYWSNTDTLRPLFRGLALVTQSSAAMVTTNLIQEELLMDHSSLLVSITRGVEPMVG